MYKRQVYDLSGLSFSPQIKIEGDTDEDALIRKLRDLEPEFIDFILEALSRREGGAYVTADSRLYRLCGAGRRHPVSYTHLDVYTRQRQGGQELRVAESSLLLYAAVEDLPARRPAGEGLNVDGREYIVNDWSEDMGIATCLLYTSRCV